MMPIILKHLSRAMFMRNHAVIRKTPPDALELAQPGDNILVWQPQLAAHNQRRERVQHIMLARHGQRQRERLAACLIDHIKQHIQANLTHIYRAQIRLLRKTIRAHRPPDLGQYRAHPLIIHTHHRQPVERQIVQKAHKTLLQIIETAAVILQMIRINIRHHRNHRLQKQKRRIRLIRFRDQILTIAQTRITACCREHPANDKRRVQPGISEDGGNQTRRRRLAVRTRDRNPETETHQFGQHLGTADDRNPQLARAQHFRIGRINRR